MATPSSVLIKAIKEHCKECCCGLVKEVSLCPAEKCNLWPYRNGDPNKRKRELTNEQRERFIEQMQKARKTS